MVLLIQTFSFCPCFPAAMSQRDHGLMTRKLFEETRKYSPHSCTPRQHKEWTWVLNYEGNFLPSVTEEWWNTFQQLKISPGSLQRRLTLKSHMCTEYSPSGYFRQTVAVLGNIHLTKRKCLWFAYLHTSQSRQPPCVTSREMGSC